MSTKFKVGDKVVLATKDRTSLCPVGTKGRVLQVYLSACYVEFEDTWVKRTGVVNQTITNKHLKLQGPKVFKSTHKWSDGKVSGVSVSTDGLNIVDHQPGDEYELSITTTRVRRAPKFKIGQWVRFTTTFSNVKIGSCGKVTDADGKQLYRVEHPGGHEWFNVFNLEAY